MQLRVLPSAMQSLRQAKEGIDDLCRVPQSLREVSGVVPTSIDDDALLAVDHGPITMAYAMHSGHRHSAPLAIEKVHRFQDGRAPHIGFNLERPGANGSRFQNVRTGLPDLREIHQLIFSERRLDRLDRLGQHCASRGLINQAKKLVALQTAGDMLLPAPDWYPA